MDEQDVVFQLEMDETLDELILGNYKIAQSRAGYRFSIDAVLLAHFVNLESINTPVIDLGTGNGVIPLLLAARSSNLNVIGIELQELMAQRAQRNLLLNGLEDRLSIILGDVREMASLLPGGMAQLVMSNPPFWPIGKGKICRNPEQALARHEQQGQLSDFIEAAAYLLKPHGRLCLVHRKERLKEIMGFMKANDLYASRLRMVHSFKNREARLLLIEGIKEYEAEMAVLPPLFIYQEQGIYSQEVQRWYHKLK